MNIEADQLPPDLARRLATAKAQGRGYTLAFDAFTGWRLTLAAPAKRQRPRCAAKCRDGSPCQARALTGRRRCRMHGGLSTGPRSAEGRARIAQANQQRQGTRYRVKARPLPKMLTEAQQRGQQIARLLEAAHDPRTLAEAARAELERRQAAQV